LAPLQSKNGGFKEKANKYFYYAYKYLIIDF
jgi:hypothetical protein